jgi:hypothetical protein
MLPSSALTRALVLVMIRQMQMKQPLKVAKLFTMKETVALQAQENMGPENIMKMRNFMSARLQHDFGDFFIFCCNLRMKHLG